MKSVRRSLTGRYWKNVITYFLVYCLILNTTLPVALAVVPPDAGTLPSGPSIPTGYGSVDEYNYDITNQLHISGIENGTIINWENFDIGSAALTKFHQGDIDHAVLNRIAGGDMTRIFGTLEANGSVFIVNPAGIVFGAGSTVNVTQLVASSLDITNPNFDTGNYEFLIGDGIGEVTNNGTITAAEGVALLGKNVLNTGTITTTDPGGFVVMAAGDRVLLGTPGSKIIVEMDKVTLTDPENPKGFGNVVNQSIDETKPGIIESPEGTIVLAAGDIFSIPLHPQLQAESGEVADQPVRVESGIGTVTQSGIINADGINGGSVILTAGDEVILATDSVTSANGGISNAGANGGEVVAYASEFYANNAEVDFQTGAVISVLGGTYEEPLDAAAIDPAATFNGGLAEISGDHMYFNGTVNATATIGAFEIPGPDYPGDPLSRITIVPEGGTLHIDPVNLTIADGGIPPVAVGGAAVDTFYEKVLEAYSQTGVNTILEADYDITVEHITDGIIQGGSGDIALRTVYDEGSIEFLPATEGAPITTTVQTTAGDIFMLAGEGDIKTGMLTTEEEVVDVVELEGTLDDYILEPGRIRIFTNNGGTIDIEKGPADGAPALMVDGGNEVEVSVIASGNLTINGDVLTSTNNVPNKEQAGAAQVCLVSANGSVNVIGAIEVTAHGKGSTVARVHICAPGPSQTVTVYTGNGRVDAWADTAGAGTADAEIKIHAGTVEEPGAISVTNDGGNPPIRARAQTGGSGVGPLSVSDAVAEYELQDPLAPAEPQAHLLIQIADAWLGGCDDCPVPEDLLPPVQPPQIAPIANDDDYTMDKSWFTLFIDLVIDGLDGILVDGVDGYGADEDPDGDPLDLILIPWLLEDVFEGPTAEWDGVGGWVVLDQDTGGFTYTPPEDPDFVPVSDYAEFIDTFTYYVEDPDGLTSNEATVTITSTNTLPTGGYTDILENKTVDPIIVQEGAVVTYFFDIGSDLDGDPVSIVPGSITTATGTITSEIEEGGKVIGFNYEPDLSVLGPGSFDSSGYTDGYAQISYDVTDGFNTSTVETEGIVDVDLINLFPVGGYTDILESKNVDPIIVQEGAVVTYLFDIGSDPDGDSVSIVPGSITTATGTITSEIEEDGKVIGFNYEPDLSVLGPGSFDSSGHTDGYAQISYDVTDGYNTSTVETEGIVDVDLINRFPVGGYTDILENKTVDPIIVQEGAVVTYLFDIGSDPDGDPVSIVPGSITTATGTIISEIEEDGKIIGFNYEPDLSVLGPGSFDSSGHTDGYAQISYDVTDGYNTSTVETEGIVDVDLINLFPVGGYTDILENKTVDPIIVQEGAVVTYLFDIGSDPDGDPVSIVPGSITTATGTIISEIEEDGKIIGFNYEPDLSVLGPGSFDSSGHTDGYAQISYDVTDGYNTSTVETEGIVDVDLINMLPVAQSDSYNVAYNVTLDLTQPGSPEDVITGVLPTNVDYDDDGDTLEAFLFNGGSTTQDGTITLNLDGSFVYEPPSDWSGVDSFTYYVSDGYNNSEPVQVTIYVGTAPPPPTPSLPYITAAPGLERIELEVSGCPALMAWAAAELGVDEGMLEIWMVNALASTRDIQPCDTCASLKQAATILQDAEGTHIAALAQVINEFASSTAPPTEEQMASIADAIAQNAGAGTHYAAAGEYLDALAQYVGTLNSQMGFSIEQSIEFATNKYVGPLAAGDNVGLAAYIAAQLAAMGG